MGNEDKTRDPSISEVKELGRKPADKPDLGTFGCASKIPLGDQLRKKAELQLEDETCVLPPNFATEYARKLIHELRVHEIELEMQNEELRRVQNDIEISRSRYADLYDFAPVGYLTFDREGLIVEANLTAAKQLGKERARILEKPFLLYVPGKDKDAFHLHLAKVFKTGERQTCEVRLAPGTGEGFYARLDSIFIEDASGKGLARTSVSDISYSKRAEEKLRRSEAKYRDLLDNIPQKIFYKDRNSVFMTVNPSYAKDFEMLPDDFVGKTDYDFYPKALAEKYRADDQRIMSSGVAEELDESYITRGETWSVHTVKSPVYDENGAISGILGIFWDITERKQMEEELLKSRDELDLRVRERTAELEKANEELRQIPSRLISVQEEERKRLASELHDSIGQTLAALKLWVEMTLRHRDEGNGSAAFHRLEQFVPILQRSIEETRNIYMGLRPPMLDSVGLLSTLEWLCRECMRLYPDRHIEFEAGIAEEEIPESLKASIFRVSQEALNNIAKHSKAEWVDIFLSNGGNGIELVISDDGVGIDLDRILQTSTAKSLGLTSMRERTELTGGRFSIDSTPGEGTTIRACWSIEAEDEFQKG